MNRFQNQPMFSKGLSLSLTLIIIDLTSSWGSIIVIDVLLWYWLLLAESKFDSTSFFDGDSLIYSSQIDWLTQCPVSTSAGWSVSAYLANLVTGLIWLPKNMSDHIDLATQSFLRLASLPGVCRRVLMTPNGASWRRHTLLTKGRLYSSPCNSVQPVY